MFISLDQIERSQAASLTGDLVVDKAANLVEITSRHRLPTVRTIAPATPSASVDDLPLKRRASMWAHKRCTIFWFRAETHCSKHPFDYFTIKEALIVFVVQRLLLQHALVVGWRSALDAKIVACSLVGLAIQIVERLATAKGCQN
ncbi:hypothetical protein [Nitratireductor luteus]|uniref:hypothetical protein n=1 Tax=Nitratireductor luteus TaxID=2976980 RepID=UPI00223E9818|nr:hypothetical protein [Nitratireductor luteus]